MGFSLIIFIWVGIANQKSIKFSVNFFIVEKSHIFECCICGESFVYQNLHTSFHYYLKIMTTIFIKIVQSYIKNCCNFLVFFIPFTKPNRHRRAFTPRELTNVKNYVIIITTGENNKRLPQPSLLFSFGENTKNGEILTAAILAVKYAKK